MDIENYFKRTKCSRKPEYTWSTTILWLNKKSNGFILPTRTYGIYKGIFLKLVTKENLFDIHVYFLNAIIRL